MNLKPKRTTMDSNSSRVGNRASDAGEVIDECDVTDTDVEWLAETVSEYSPAHSLSDSQSERMGGLAGIFGRFFQEQNIRWMLILGALTVLGSTLMLVSREWSQWSAIFKCITVLGYTAMSGVSARVAGQRLGLRATCRVLQALTVMLCPTCFLALNWLTAGTAAQSALSHAEFLVLLMIAGLLTLYFVRDIFRSWLQTDQPVFLVSYTLLSFAGALSAASSPLTSALLVAALWVVMTAGVIKVNRHVFWLTESHQRAKVFGFFPILLLSGLFITVASLKSWKTIPLEWVGAIAVLQSFTILVTARSVASVYRQRTGGLIYPLPWSVVMPIVVGLSVLLGGLGLSFYGFSWNGNTTYAAVPTAMLAAGLLWSSASDLRSRPLAWIALVVTAIAYQNLPSLCPEVIRALKGEVAAAINQSRVPLSFYGITYLPLLVSLAVIARRCHQAQRSDLSDPIRQFVWIVALGWLCFSQTNPAAAFWVPLSFSVAWPILAVILADRRCILPAIVSTIAATVGLARFAVALGYVSTPIHLMVCGLSLLAITWTTFSVFDRWQTSLTLPKGWWKAVFVDRSNRPRKLFLQSARLIAVAVFVLWLVACRSAALRTWGVFEIAEWGLVAMVFAMPVFQVRTYLQGFSFWFVMAFGLVSLLLSKGMLYSDLFNVASITSGLITSAGYLIFRVLHNGTDSWSGGHSWSDLRRELGFRTSVVLATAPESEKDGLSRLSKVCVVPLVDLCLGVLACLAVFFHLPQQLLFNLQSANSSLFVSNLLLPLWLILAAASFQYRSLAFLAGILIPLTLYSGISTLIGHDLSATAHAICWVCGAMISAGICRWLSPGNAAVLRLSTLGWLIMIYACSLLLLGTQARIASVGALIVLSTLQLPWSPQVRNTALLIGAEIQGLLCLAQFAGLKGALPMVVTLPQLPDAVVWCMPGFAACALLPVMIRDRFHLKILSTWSVIAQTVTLILMPLGLLCADNFVPGWQLMVLASCCLAVNWIRDAVVFQRVWRAWAACILVGGTIFWLACIEVFSLTSIATMWSLLIVASILSLAGMRIPTGSPWRILSKPLLMSGRALPFAVAIVALTSGLSHDHAGSEAIRIGTAFSCSALYFLGWIRTRNSRDLLLAVMTLNLAVVTGSLITRLNDAQFYLVPLGASILAVVQLLRQEISSGMRDACRYVGAFLVLCSPLLGVTEGSWWHALSLMVLSLCVAMAGIGLRLRILTFSGTAFLAADLLWMIVRTSIDHPGFLWISGVAVGAAVIALAAYCENHREQLLGRIRMLTAELATWK